MELVLSSEPSVLVQTTWRHIPEDGNGGYSNVGKSTGYERPHYALFVGLLLFHPSQVHNHIKSFERDRLCCLVVSVPGSWFDSRRYQSF
jgi:hypothetical protein